MFVSSQEKSHNHRPVGPIGSFLREAVTQARTRPWEEDKRQAWERDYTDSHRKPSLPVTPMVRCRIPALA